MKKYITIAALLAAGTTFASAETSANTVTSITWETLRGCDATFYSSSQTTVGKSLSLTASERVQFDVSALDIDFATGVYEFSFAVTDFTAANGPMIAWGLGTGTTTDAQKYGFGAASSNNVWCWAATINGSNMTQRYSSSMGFDVTGLDATSPISGIFNIKIGTFDIGTENAKFELEVVFIDSSKNVYTLTPVGGLEMGTIGEACNISSVTLGGWASTSNNGCAMTVTSVPEPSAFGLLAGIGALALVASRRRRK